MNRICVRLCLGLGEKERRMGKEYPSTKKVLKLLSGGAFLAFALLMPGLPLILKPKYKRDYRKWQKFDPNRLKQTINRLKDRGIVTVTEEGNQAIVKIAKEGKEELLRYDLDNMKIKRPIRWDKKWRFVIFDIPNEKRTTGDLFRRKLKGLDFFHFQRSIFVHPFPCEKEIKFLRVIWEIEPFVRYLVVDCFEGEELVRLKFNL